MRADRSAANATTRPGMQRHGPASVRTDTSAGMRHHRARARPAGERAARPGFPIAHGAVDGTDFRRACAQVLGLGARVAEPGLRGRDRARARRVAWSHTPHERYPTIRSPRAVGKSSPAAIGKGAGSAPRPAGGLSPEAVRNEVPARPYTRARHAVGDARGGPSERCFRARP